MSTPSAHRVAQVFGQSGFGTGYRLTTDLVVTAAHILSPGGSTKVRIHGIDATLTSKCVWAKYGGPEVGMDIAVLQLEAGSAALLPPVEPAFLGGISGERHIPVELVGYPDSMKLGAGRDLDHVAGRLSPIAAAASGRYVIDVESSPDRRLGKSSEWAGMSGAPVISGPDSACPGAVLGVAVGVVDAFGNRRLLASAISDAIEQEAIEGKPVLRNILLKSGGDVLLRDSSATPATRVVQLAVAMPNERDFMVVSEEEELQALMRSSPSVLLYAYYSPGDHAKKAPDAVGTFRSDVFPLLSPLQRIWEFEVAYTIVGISREFFRGIDLFRTETSIHNYLKQRNMYFPGLHLFSASIPSGSIKRGIQTELFDYFSDAYNLLHNAGTFCPGFGGIIGDVTPRIVTPGHWELSIGGSPAIEIVYSYGSGDRLYVDGNLILERNGWAKVRKNHPARFEFEHNGAIRSGFVTAHPDTGEIALVLDGELVYWSNLHSS